MQSDADVTLFGVEIETLILDPLASCKLLPIKASAFENCKANIDVQNNVENVMNQFHMVIENAPHFAIIRKLRRRLLADYMKNHSSPSTEPSSSSLEYDSDEDEEDDDVSSINPTAHVKSVSSDADVKTLKLNFTYTNSYHGSLGDTKIEGPVWVVDHDSSVQRTQNSLRAVTPYTKLNNRIHIKTRRTTHAIVENMEIVSPPLELTSDAPSEQLQAVFEKMNGGEDDNLIFYNNSTTSNHIHMTIGDKFKDPLNLLKICIAWWWFEPVFMSLVPKWRRNNEYCKTMRQITAEKFNAHSPTGDAAIMSDHNLLYYVLGIKSADEMAEFLDPVKKTISIKKIIALFQGSIDDHNTRYAALNLLNLVERKEISGTGETKAPIGTIEVRVKHGSTDVNELMNFVRLFELFFKSAMEKNMKYFDAVGGELIMESLMQLQAYDPENNKLYETNVTNLLQGFIGGVADISSFINDQQRKVNIIKRSPVGANRMVIEHPSLAPPQSAGGKKPRTYPVFSYGSNSTAQIAERTGARGLVPIGGHIEDHTRIFSGYSTRWHGGVASIHPKHGSRVYGSIFRLTKEQLETLDTFEGGYLREQLPVTLDTGNKTVKCFVYIKTNFEYSKPPSRPYLEAIKNMLHEAPDRRHTNKIMIRGLIKNARGKWIIRTVGHYDAVNNVVNMVMRDAKTGESPH